MICTDQSRLEALVSGVYKITSPTGKIYIGSSNIIWRRYREYRALRCKPQVRLYNSLNKHGFYSHVFEIIEECPVDLLLERERYWGLKFNSIGKRGLNSTLPAAGEKRGSMTDEYREKLLSSRRRGEQHPFFGKTLSDETRRKISIAHTGKKLSSEHVEKIRVANKGRKMTEVSKRAMSLSKLGIKRSQEVVEILKRAFKGRKGTACKIVLCLRTGIYYDSAKDAATARQVPHSTLKCHLNGTVTNRSDMIYVN